MPAANATANVDPGVVQAGYRRTVVLMDTFVTIQLSQSAPGCEQLVERAFDWFRRVEAACSRFEAESEVMLLTRQAGKPVAVSDIVYEAVSFALAVAAASGGAFDPTVGRTLEERGFNRNYATGERIATPISSHTRPTYRDVRLDPARRTLNLRQPLILDLGAVAKGLAIDLAARELATSCANFAIDAGGDLFVAGKNPARQAWQIGIRHPREGEALLGQLHLSNLAVCTSGDDSRRAGNPDLGHHLIDPRSGRSPESVASVTVIAPTAMAADALATAAAILGPQRGLRLLRSQGVEGLIITPTLAHHATAGFEEYWQC